MSEILNNTKQVFSRVCICGHIDWTHHANSIWPKDIRDAMESQWILGECEHGTDCACQRYIDVTDPNREEKIAAVKDIYGTEPPNAG